MSASSTLRERLRGGEILAVFFFVKRDTELFEKGDSSRGRIRAEHVTDDAPIAAPEIPLGHDAVGDIAARSAADEDFGPNRLRAVHADDARARCGSCAEECGGEPGCPRADDRRRLQYRGAAFS